ncbi:hypothetical protein B0O99DRAFT_616015 [Bisporella sp. PMI_857]|nr:hypothetical protein B0O99DRAFT_616015 [Bisporella sp. PMI_857]
MEVNRLSRETHGRFVLDGVVTCIDVENWAGYEDTSYTARIQAKYMDLVVFNKWEHVGERRWDECLDRLGDLGADVAWVRSDRGKVPVGVVFGIDGGLARSLGEARENGHKHEHEHEHAHGKKGHQSEVEVLSVTLQGEEGAVVNTQKLEKLLKSAPKDEVYRIKAVLAASSPIASSDESISPTNGATGGGRYILNWAFSRWTCTPLKTSDEHESSSGVVLRMTIILARYESTKWKKRIEGGCYIELEGDQTGVLKAEKII